MLQQTRVSLTRCSNSLSQLHPVATYAKRIYTISYEMINTLRKRKIKLYSSNVQIFCKNCLNHVCYQNYFSSV